MARKSIAIVATNTAEVDEDTAADLQDAWSHLKNLPSTRAAVMDFDADDYEGPDKENGKVLTADQKAAKAARLFVRKAKVWAESQKGPHGRRLAVVRKGDVSGQPSRVTFRIYEMREDETPEPESESAE
jgi:hypothetical protein